MLYANTGTDAVGRDWLRRIHCRPTASAADRLAAAVTACAQCRCCSDLHGGRAKWWGTALSEHTHEQTRRPNKPAQHCWGATTAHRSSCHSFNTILRMKKNPLRMRIHVIGSTALMHHSSGRKQHGLRLCQCATGWPSFHCAHPPTDYGSLLPACRQQQQEAGIPLTPVQLSDVYTCSK